MALYPTTDLALVFDAAGFACDLSLVDGDLALDATPVTPMLVSLGSDRRARSDDRLPSGEVSPTSMPVAWDERRGWVGDALDPAGRRIGARLWLLVREHDGEATARRADDYAAEALAWARDELGIEPEIAADWVRRGVLRLRAMIDGRAVTLQRKVS